MMTRKSTNWIKQGFMYVTLLLTAIVIPVQTNAQAAPGEFESMLIVTHDDYLEAADTLAAWKRQMGYTIYIVSNTAWEEDQIKDTIHYYINNMELDFFLMLGDIDKAPSQSFWHMEFLSYTTDLYFACVDGPDDFVPDCAYGRISVADADEAMNVVKKIVNYERTPIDLPSFYQKASVISYFQEGATGSGRASAGYAETACKVRDHIIAQGYETDKIFYADSLVQPLTFTSGAPVPDSLMKPNYAWDGDADKIASAIDDGRFLVVYRDHGLPDAWQHPKYTVDDINALTNGPRLPVIISICCTTGQYYTDIVGFCEALLRNPLGGAVGAIGSQTGNGATYNNAFIAGLIDAIWPSPRLAISHTNPNPQNSDHEPMYQMGRIMNRGKKSMAESLYGIGVINEGARHNHEKYHYFGDPSMKIWTAVPQAITATHDTKIELNQSEFNITGVSCTTGIATIYSGGKVLGREYLDGGEATITFDSAPASSAHALLTITKHNNQPYQQAITIGDPAAVHTSIALGTGNNISLVNYDALSNTLALTIENPKSANVNISLIDLKGKIHWRMASENVASGNHSIKMESKLPAGIYLATIKTGHKSWYQKLTIN